MRLKGYILLCIVCSFYWILDSIWSFLSFELNLRKLIFSEPASYIDTFLLQVPPYQFVSRIMVLVLFAILGALIIEYLIKKHETDRVLIESEERYQALIEDLPALICSFLPGGVITFANKAYCDYFDKTPESLVGMNFQTLIPENQRKEVMKGLSTLTSDFPVMSHEHNVILPEGKVRWQRWTNRAIFDVQNPEKIISYQAIGEDITPRKLAEESLRQSLKEKELLLKEIHHRVKNHLQMVESLLNLQLSVIQDSRLSSILMDSRNRVRSMALVHETLYRSTELSSIDVRHYIEELVVLLLKAMKPPDAKIDLNYDIESLSLDIDSIIACGMIVNELVNNAMKYAFVNKDAGIVEISLKAVDGELAELMIKDNGPGMPVQYNTDQSSLGLKIVKILAEQQLDGNVSITNEQGTTFLIQFPIKQGKIDDNGE